MESAWRRRPPFSQALRVRGLIVSSRLRRHPDILRGLLRQKYTREGVAEAMRCTHYSFGVTKTLLHPPKWLPVYEPISVCKNHVVSARLKPRQVLLGQKHVLPAQPNFPKSCP